jgi:hypothetical protein
MDWSSMVKLVRLSPTGVQEPPRFVPWNPPNLLVVTEDHF